MRKFRDSGIDWIGRIPENWKTNKFKHLFRIKKIIAGKLGYDVLSVTQQGIKVKNITSNEGQIANDYSNYQLVFPNDFVMNHMDLLTGYVDVSKQDGVTSPDYRTFYAIHPIEVINQYYLYIFQFCYKTRLFYNLGQGVSNFGRWRLPTEQQKEFVLPYPPVKEQQQIVDYLDKKCGEIDSLISLQEQMIENLKAYKQSVITEAVTKGLDPNAKLVPSGIDWIGDIPEGWKVMRIKNVTSNYKAGPFGSALITGNLLHEGKILVYTPEHVADSSKIFHNTNNLFLQEERRIEMSQFFVKAGDVVFPIVGSLGRALVIEEKMPEGIINQRLSKFSIDRNLIDESYFMWLFGKSSFYAKYIEMNCRGSFIVNLTKVIVGDMPLPTPPLSEQHAIAAYLDEKCADIDRLIALKQQKIEKLKDYKKSVIYEAVTGKTSIE